MAYRITDARRNVRKRNQGNDKLAIVLAVIAVGLVLAVLSAGIAALGAWFLMLGVGIVHLNWWPLVPTLGFWTAFLIDLTIGTWVALQGAWSRASQSKGS